MNVMERAEEYLYKTDIPKDADYEGYRIRGLLAEFADAEVKLALSNMKNEQNNLRNEKASNRLMLRQRDDLAKIAVALLDKNKVLDLLQNCR